MDTKRAMTHLAPALILLGMATLTMAEELDAYGGLRSIQGERTGFFHLQQINGRDWFITPEGNAFFAVALSHLYSGDSDLACANVYEGDVDAWLDGSFKKARALGFNCALGSATSPERNLNGFVDLEKVEAVFRKNNFPYSVGVILLKHPWEFVEGETLPDIFEPAYEEMIKSRAAAVCPKYKDDPLVMGYFYGFGAFNSAATWVNHHLSLPARTAGRETIVNLLIERYDNDASHFNTIYGTSLSDIAELKSSAVLSYDEIYEHRNYPDVRTLLNQEMLDDFEAIISLMCTRLYKIGHDAIRRWDKNHLILGSFVKEWALSVDSWKAVAPYVDVIAPQHLNRDISVNALAKAVNLPMIISDDEIGFCYDPGPGYCCVESHAARAELYEANLMRNFKDPRIIGASYCACMYDQGGKALKYNQQAGFYDRQGNPRPQLIRTVTSTNKSVYLHSTNSGDQQELDSLMERYFSKWDQYKRLSQWELNQIKQLNELKLQQQQKREAVSVPK
ncbi:hypothetical protein CA13_29540 [Planctomycetes bacterium CA13]|uniref:Glycoside hydrolase family 42 N-terminal domain-containing protein n=1 Tax=Novipirellula herctigrandis TaxID=2527986 RepID=A0A5C5Z3U2_9BACT|nr:hypothetical protein CA13_29540 [Planctomycetes bacterium CA13]